MAVAPAIGLGLLVVFLLGGALTYWMVGLFIKRKRVQQALHPDAARQAAIDNWTEERISKIAVAGGIFTIGLLILSFFILPRTWFIAAWIGLTVLGILFGIFTFVVDDFSKTTVIYPRKEAPRPAETPPPRPAAPPPAPLPPTPTDNPYRDLLVKVRYDTALAERLIAYERTRAPNATVDDLCRNAIARLEHDNG